MNKYKLIVVCAVTVLMASCGGKKKVTVHKKNRPATTVSTVKTNEKVITAPTKEEQKELLEATSSVVVETNTVEEYINVYKDIAMVEMQRYKIPASITLAQAILESGSGKGDLCLEANNHFGIKCHKEWKGESVKHDDDLKQECFRKYDHPNKSFEDHSLFLKNRGHYAFLFKLEPSDYKGWAKGLKKAGYATDPRYPSKLISIIERYELYEYDKLVLKDDYVLVVEEPEVIATNSGSGKVHVVQKGDTLYNISKRYGVSVDQILKDNNLKNSNIAIGQKLKIAK